MILKAQFSMYAESYLTSYSQNGCRSLCHGKDFKPEERAWSKQSKVQCEIATAKWHLPGSPCTMEWLWECADPKEQPKNSVNNDVCFRLLFVLTSLGSFGFVFFRVVIYFALLLQSLVTYFGGEHRICKTSRKRNTESEHEWKSIT